VDAGAYGRRQHRQQKHKLSKQNSKPSDGLEPSTPLLTIALTERDGRTALVFRFSLLLRYFVSYAHPSLGEP
jgi:hypothetical protein